MKRLHLLSRHLPSLSSSSSLWYLSRPLHVASSSRTFSSLPSPSFSFSLAARRRRERRALSLSPHTPTLDCFSSSSLLSSQHPSKTGDREKVSFFSSPSVLGEDQEIDASPIQSPHLSPKIRKNRLATRHFSVEQEEEERRSIGEGRDRYFSPQSDLSRKQDGSFLRQERKRNADSFPSSLLLSFFSLSFLKDREPSSSSLLHLRHIHTSSSCSSPCLIKTPSSFRLSSAFSSPFHLSSPLFNSPPISLSLSSSLSLYRHFSSSPSSPPRSSSSPPPSHLPRRSRGLLPFARLSFSNEEEAMEREARKRWAVTSACMYFLLMSVAFAFVPLYEAFCQATGYGGEVQIRKPGEKKATKKRSTERKGGEEQEDEEEEDDEREEGGIPMRERTGGEDEVLLEIDFASHCNLPWEFKPLQKKILVAPGESALAFYRAKNRLDQPLIGISLYNVMPPEAGIYFNKIQCFCFEEQMLNPKEEVDLPVFFFIDPDILDDPRLDQMRRITLSYVFNESDAEIPSTYQNLARHQPENDKEKEEKEMKPPPPSRNTVVL